MSISLFWCDLPQGADESLSALCYADEFFISAEADADICIYGHNHCRGVSTDLAIIMRESDVLLSASGAPDCDYLLPVGVPVAHLQHVLKQAVSLLKLRQKNEEKDRQLQYEQDQFQRLMDIGLALSAEQDHHQLLERILKEARRFGECDAASIFLIDRSAEEPELVFKLTQNDSLVIDFKEHHFALDDSSLAGHAALSGELLNIADVYQLPPDHGYGFNRDFDRQTGYRTRSMLVIPMRTHDGRIVGVIQFINRKYRPIQLTSPEQTERETLAFDNKLEALLKTMASQAAVAIENNLLMERINQLFEGFVSASVRAIEQRDPSTSGHSFRVAELTTSLAEAVHIERSHQYHQIQFSAAELRELRYAALLHDFGKVGVREHVLVKAKKLSPKGYLRFQYRLALQIERIKNQFMHQRLVLAKAGKLTSAAEEDIALKEADQLLALEQTRVAVEQANEPTVLEEGTAGYLQDIRSHLFADIDGENRPLLDEHEFLALAVKRGSLTEGERNEIESHVTHTINFLSTIPWTPELERIPLIAGAHHEKLDGSGYPHGLKENEIPIGAKIMTICDIFDALTASDRPYKPALTLTRALDILAYDSASGKIDASLLSLFSKLPHQKILPALRLD